jgi:hypothetical protein
VNPIGWVIFTFRDFPSEQAIQVQVFNETGAEVSSDLEAFFQQTVIHWLYFDLMGKELLLAQILANAEAPFRFELIQSGLVAEYQLSYIDANAAVVGNGGGLLQATYSSQVPSGHLVVAARNQRFVDQTYVVEHGGVVLAQSSGAVMASPPSFQAVASAGAASLVWTLPGLSGSAVSRSGTTLALVATPRGAPAETFLSASQVAFTIPTAYGAAWCEHFRSVLTNGGLTSTGASPQFTVASTSAQCLVTVYGPVSTPSDLTEDVLLRVRTSESDLALTLVG